MARLGRKQDSIEYLLRRRFGSLAPPPTLNLSGSGPDKGAQQHFETIQAARAEYEALTTEQVEALAASARKEDADLLRAKLKKEEQELFFNLPSATADLSYWAKMATWSLDEAVALSLGKNPTVVNSVRMSGERFVPEAWSYSQFPKEYVRRRELALRASAAYELDDPVKPQRFLDWAVDHFDSIPAALTDAVRAREVVTPMTTQKIIKGEKALGDRERNNLLRVIAALAIDAGIPLEIGKGGADNIAAACERSPYGGPKAQSIRTYLELIRKLPEG